MSLILADTPRTDFLGEVSSETTAALVVMNTAITFHNGNEMTQHSGQPWQFHDPVYPDQQLANGRNGNSVPRTEYAGEVDK